MSLLLLFNKTSGVAAPTAFLSMTDSAHVLPGGTWQSFGTPTAFGGHSLCHRVSTNPSVDTVVVGTDCVVNGYGLASCTVDGGAPFAIGTSGALFTTAIFTALADTGHTVHIHATADFYLDQSTIDATHCTFAVTGAAPALSAPANFGPQYVLGGAGITIGAGWSAVAPIPGTGINGYKTLAWSGPSIRFYATCTAISLYVYGQSLSQYQLRMDGVDVGSPVSLVANSIMGWQQIASGLDGGAEHLYEIACAQPQIYYAATILTTAGTLNTAKTPAVRPVLAGFGDSITSGTAGGATPESTYFQKLGILKNFDVVNTGISGSTVTTVGGTSPGISRTADVTSVSPQPKYCFVLYGTNDAYVLSRSTAQLQADFSTMLASLLAGTSTTIFYCLGLIPRSGHTQANTDTYNVAIAAAVAAAGSARAIYVETRGWNLASAGFVTGGAFVGTNYADGTTHPNDAGYTIMANQMVSLIFSSSLLLARRRRLAA